MATQRELTHLGAGSPCVDVRMHWSQRASQSWHVAGWVVHPSNGKEGRQEGSVGACGGDGETLVQLHLCFHILPLR